MVKIKLTHSIYCGLPFLKDRISLSCYNFWVNKVIYTHKQMKAFAVALLGLAVTAPAMAGPYVESKHEFKGTDEDFSKQVHQGRVGYEWKMGKASPYVEGGIGRSVPDAGEGETFYALEVGSKLKITDSLSAYAKYENLFQEDETRDWKVELGTKYKF